MNGNVTAALLLSLGAGLATILGGVAAVAVRHPGRRLLGATLGFSGGVMATVSLTDLIPTAAAGVAAAFPRPIGVLALTAACIGGMLAACLMDVLLPEGKASERDGLFRLGLFSMLVLLAHNLPEGMAVFLSGSRDLRRGVPLAVAIALHNIPEGVMVAMPVMAADGNRALAVGMSALSGLAEPAGALLGWALLRPILTASGLALLYAGIAGLMLAIVFSELIPAALSYGNPGASLAGTLTGVVVMIGSLYLI